MSDNEMLRHLQDYFDGEVPDAGDVVRRTGLPAERAVLVAGAIRRLVSGRFPDRGELIQTAADANASERDGDGGRERELGFLSGTAHMVILQTITANGGPDDESYSDLLGTVAEEIDKRAAVESYPILKENGYKKPKKK